MNCKESQKLFSSYFEEELSVAEETELRTHLDTCARCARDYREFEATVHCVRRMPKEVAPPEMTTMIMSRVRRYEPRRAWPIFAPRMRIAAALAAMLAVGFLSGYGIFAMGVDVSPQSPNRAQQVESTPANMADAANSPVVLDSLPVGQRSIIDDFELPGGQPGLRVRGGDETPSIVF